MWCLAMRYKLTRQTVVVWINHAQTIVWFVGLGCKSKMWLIPTLSVVPNYIPSNIKEDNLRVQTFRVLYASGTAAPHTSPVGICVSWRPTQRPCDVIWMMCYHLSILLDNPCCSKRWHGIRILKCHVTEVTVTSMLTLLWHLSVSHDVTGWQHLYWRQ